MGVRLALDKGKLASRPTTPTWATPARRSTSTTRARRCRSGFNARYFIELLGEIVTPEVQAGAGRRARPGRGPPRRRQRLPRRRHADAALSSLVCDPSELRPAAGATSSRWRCSPGRGPRCSTGRTARARPTCSRPPTTWPTLALVPHRTSRSWSAGRRPRPGWPPQVTSARSARLERRLEVDARARRAKPVAARRQGGARRGRRAAGAGSVVLFVPEDLLLPRAAPAARRRFLDRAVFNVDRALLRARRSPTRRCCKSRNAVLAAGDRRPGPARHLRRGAGPHRRPRGDAPAGAGGRRWRRGSRSCSCALHGDLPAPHPLPQRSRTSPRPATRRRWRRPWLAGLRARRALDQRRRFTGFGPHTDDLDIELGGRPAREHGSQGQLRSLVLALKLAELGAPRGAPGRAAAAAARRRGQRARRDPAAHAVRDHRRACLARRSSRSPTRDLRSRRLSGSAGSISEVQ